MDFVPAALNGVDWGEIWKEYQHLRHEPDDSSYWDKRAPSFQKIGVVTPYARKFIELAGVQPGETVFDMGCGSGTLSLPLAAQGTRMVARDFSPVMLELMMKQAKVEGTTGNIDALRLSWSDEWTEENAPVCDVAFASRSIITQDLKESLLKLESRARRRVCITMTSGVSPHHDEELLRVIGRRPKQYPEHMLCMNILWQLGRQPSLQYIDSGRDAIYASPEEAAEKNAHYLEATPEERTLLEEYSAHNMHQAQTDEGNGWTYNHKRRVHWAFISWDSRRTI